MAWMPLADCPNLNSMAVAPHSVRPVFCHAADVVIAVHLQDDPTIAVIVLAEGADHILEQLALLDLGIFAYQVRVLVNGALTDHSQHTCHGCAAEVLRPGQLCHCGQHYRQL